MKEQIKNRHLQEANGEVTSALWIREWVEFPNIGKESEFSVFATSQPGATSNPVSASKYLITTTLFPPLQRNGQPEKHTYEY